MTMTPAFLRTLLPQKEGALLEFKLGYDLEGREKAKTANEKAETRNEVAKDLLALANTAGFTGETAYLILGAGNDLGSDGRREPKNHKGSFELRWFFDILRDKSTPPVRDLDYEEVELDGVTYGVVALKPSYCVHYLSKELVTEGKKVWRQNVTVHRL